MKIWIAKSIVVTVVDPKPHEGMDSQALCGHCGRPQTKKVQIFRQKFSPFRQVGNNGGRASSGDQIVHPERGERWHGFLPAHGLHAAVAAVGQHSPGSVDSICHTAGWGGVRRRHLLWKHQL